MGKHSAAVRPASRMTKTKIVISIGAVLSMGAFATHAAFTDSANTSINVSAGTINLLVNTTGTDTKTATMDLGNAWGPGHTDNRTFTLKNTGTLPISVDMSATSLPGGLAGTLDVSVDAGSGVTYQGLLATMSFNDLIINPGTSATVAFNTSWIEDGGNDNAWQGKTDTITMTFAATNA